MIFGIIIIVVGVLEVITIGKLHEYLGTGDLVLLYLGTTAVCAIVALVFYPNFKQEKHDTNLSNKFSKRLNKKKLTVRDRKSMNSVMYCAAYIIGCVLIAIPGVITDILGLFLVVPFINRQLTSNFFSTSLEQYYVRKNEKL